MSFTFDQAFVILGLIVGIIGSLLLWVIRISAGAATIRTQMDSLLAERLITRVTSIEVKIDTIWSFQRRRAIAEGLSRGLGTLESPFLIGEKAKSWLIAIQPQLRQLYLDVGESMTEDEFELEIERCFGDQLLKLLCIPHKINDGLCLLIAACVARDGIESLDKVGDIIKEKAGIVSVS